MKTVYCSKLSKFANILDEHGYHDEANSVTEELVKLAAHGDSEYEMARNELYTAQRAIDALLDLMGDKEGNLPAWVQSKISNSVNMLKGVSDYMVSESESKKAYASDKNKGKSLNKPFRTPGGPKKFSVYVKNDKGNVVKVNFGDPNMEIKRDDPNRRKNFRARHNCDNPGPKTKARYWSCKNWEAGKSVSDITKGK
jgi:hypothetical protein